VYHLGESERKGRHPACPLSRCAQPPVARDAVLDAPGLRLLIGLVQRLGVAGYLCLDDVIIEKAYARRLPWAAWTYSFAKKRKVYGLHIIVVLRVRSKKGD
jgi:hypothetical protein